MVDGALDVEIVPDESALEDVEDREIGVTGPAGPGGDDSEGVRLAQIGRKLTLILGALGVLAQLDTIMEVLNGIFRAIEVALLPLVGLITAFLRPVLTKLLRLFADFSFDEAFGQLENVFNNVVDNISDEVKAAIPGVSGTSRFEDESFGTQSFFEGEGTREGPGGSRVIEDSPADKILDFLASTEFSNAGIQKLFSNNGEDVQNEDSPG